MNEAPLHPAPRASRATRPALAEMLLWLLAALAVWATVGVVASIVVLALLIAERRLLPGRRVLATAAVALLAAVPAAWFLGSSLPLFPPATRLNDNLLAHHLGGLAVWTLFLAAVVEVTHRDGDDA